MALLADPPEAHKGYTVTDFADLRSLGWNLKALDQRDEKCCFTDAERDAIEAIAPGALERFPDMDDVCMEP